MAQAALEHDLPQLSVRCEYPVLQILVLFSNLFFFFFNDTAPTEIYTSVNTLSLHDALPICDWPPHGAGEGPAPGPLGAPRTTGAQGHDRGGPDRTRLADAPRSAPPRRQYVRAAVAAGGDPCRRNRDDRPRVRRVRRLRLPARPGPRARATPGRRFGRQLQRAAHRAAAPDRRLLRGGDEQRQVPHRRVRAQRHGGREAAVACPLQPVTPSPPAPLPLPVAVLVSGGGTNLQALSDALRDARAARVSRVISSRPDAGALERARRAGALTTVLADPASADEVLTALGDARLVVLAGYVKRIPPAVVARFRWRLINIHPALLPAFGAAVSGATVHYVDDEYDHGPIIAQWPVPVRPDDTPDSLAARVLEVEHRLLPSVVLELARRGAPAVPVRLSAVGSAFVAGDTLGVELEQGG